MNDLKQDRIKERLETKMELFEKVELGTKVLVKE